MIIIALLVLTIGYSYLGFELIARIAELSLMAKFALWVALLLPFALILWLPIVRWRDRGEEKPETALDIVFEWAAFFSMAGMSLLLFWTLTRDVLALAFFFTGQSVQSLFGISQSLAILALALISLIIGTLSARGRPRISRVDVPIRNLPEDLRGFSIAQISDLHIGRTIAEGYVERVVDMVNTLKPDVIVLTGDIGDGEPKNLKRYIDPLAKLSAGQGRFYVTGNHEYYWDGPAWIEAMREVGFTPLLNQARTLSQGGSQVLIAGIPDPTAGPLGSPNGPNPEATLQTALAEQSNPAIGAKILLAHQPALAFAAEKAGFDLQISGHTHGGQFLPWTLIIRFFQPFVRGLNRCGKMWVYVNRGTGSWGPPVRLGSSSEISLLKLAKA